MTILTMLRGLVAAAGKDVLRQRRDSAKGGVQDFNLSRLHALQSTVEEMQLN